MNDDIVIGILLSTLIILLLTGGIALAFFMIGRQRVRQEVELAAARLAFEQELRKTEVEVSEHIMGQFARELHDNIGGHLSAIHFQIEGEKIRHPELAEGYRPVEIYLEEATQQLRLLSRTLNSDFIAHTGLLSAIEVEARRLQMLRQYRVHYDPVEGVSNLDDNQELMVLRIFQEITNNALRHAGASNLYISIHNSGTNFELEVRDDGHGFDQEAVFRSGKASGLRNILKRAALAGLTCEIYTGEGGGTRFLLKKLSSSY
jgi:signal transduction histidine kinase